MVITDLVAVNADLLLVGLAVAGIALLGFLIFFNDPSNSTNRIFLLFSLLTVVWGISNYFEYRFTTVDATLWAERFHLFISTWHALIFFTFCYVFPREKLQFPTWYKLGILPVATGTALLSLTPFVFSRIVALAPPGEVTNPDRGPGIVLFTLVAFGLLFAGLYVLFRKWLRSTGVERTQNQLVFFGMFFTALLILCFNVFFPVVLNQLTFIPLAALFTFPLIASIAYAIMRYHLFNAKVVTAEIFSFVLCLATLVQVVFSASIFELAFRAFAFLLVLAVAVLFVRSVMREIKQREEIQKLSEEKSEFMSFASHEIRNPITAMRGYSSLLMDGTVGEVSDQVRDVAQKILVNGDTVLALISEFLNKSKLELGQIAYNVADTDIAKTISSIGEGFKAHAREKGLTLEVKIDFPGLIAKADEAKLREVVGNLVDNSIKYTKSGGVTIEVEKRNGMARVIVSDTGVGIPPETVSHLFQKFSRADAQKMNLLGTGLGLYLAKTFVEGMGGKIWAESDGPNKGSRFIIELHTV